MDVVSVARFSVFFGNGYVQHVTAEYLEYGNLRKHVYRSSRGRRLHNAVIYVYTWSFSIVEDIVFVKSTKVEAMNVDIVKKW